MWYAGGPLARTRLRNRGPLRRRQFQYGRHRPDRCERKTQTVLPGHSPVAPPADRATTGKSTTHSGARRSPAHGRCACEECTRLYQLAFDTKSFSA